MNLRVITSSPVWRRLAVCLAVLGVFAVLFVAVPAVSGAEPEHAAAAKMAVHEPVAEAGFLKTAWFSYLTAYMFFLSICLGSLFIVLLHHLFDAMWIVPIRRFLEHIACLLCPWMFLFWLPIGIFAHWNYPWMTSNPATDHALHAKEALLKPSSFYIVSVLLFLIWGWITSRLRYWSILQDTASKTADGDPSLHPLERVIVFIAGLTGMQTKNTQYVLCTRMMRVHSSYGIILFALTVTMAAILWMKALQHQFFSTMYGVYYFAGSTWVALAVTYLLALYFRDKGPLKAVSSRRQFYDNGLLLFAFTVFYAYIHFAQYFLIWNAALPEETFWYVGREQGGWKWVGFLIVFGHFFIPFLMQLRIDWKLNLKVIVPVCVWAMFMHYVDMQFNVMPVIHPDGPRINLFDFIFMAGIGYTLWKLFLAKFYSHPPYPQQDPRIAETMGVYVEPAGAKAAAGHSH